MRRRTQQWGWLLTGCFLIACETSISPKTDIIEQTVLYGIATSSSRGDISQKIILSRTYDVEGLRLPDSTSDRGISGATITLHSRGFQYAMQESLFVFRRPDGGYSTRLMYTAAPIRFGPQQEMSVEAVLPDGSALSATTTSPPFVFFESSYPFSRGITSAVRDRAGAFWTLRWESLPSHMFWPSLNIFYQHQVNDSTLRSGSIAVPMTFTKRNDEIVAVYPDRSWRPSTSFSFDAIDSAMTRISEGDPEKARYRILSAEFSVIIYDPHLSRYYTSVYGSVDEFSIRSDPAFYSNISGGIGVFGSQTVSSFIYMLDPTYVRSFGYQTSG